MGSSSRGVGCCGRCCEDPSRDGNGFDGRGSSRASSLRRARLHLGCGRLPRGSRGRYGELSLVLRGRAGWNDRRHGGFESARIARTALHAVVGTREGRRWCVAPCCDRGRSKARLRQTRNLDRQGPDRRPPSLRALRRLPVDGVGRSRAERSSRARHRPRPPFARDARRPAPRSSSTISSAATASTTASSSISSVGASSPGSRSSSRAGSSRSSAGSRRS